MSNPIVQIIKPTDGQTAIGNVKVDAIATNDAGADLSASIKWTLDGVPVNVVTPPAPHEPFITLSSLGQKILRATVTDGAETAFDEVSIISALPEIVTPVLQTMNRRITLNQTVNFSLYDGSGNELEHRLYCIPYTGQNLQATGHFTTPFAIIPKNDQQKALVVHQASFIPNKKGPWIARAAAVKQDGTLVWSLSSLLIQVS